MFFQPKDLNQAPVALEKLLSLFVVFSKAMAQAEEEIQSLAKAQTPRNGLEGLRMTMQL